MGLQSSVKEVDPRIDRGHRYSYLIKNIESGFSLLADRDCLVTVFWIDLIPYWYRKCKIATLSDQNLGVQVSLTSKAFCMVGASLWWAILRSKGVSRSERPRQIEDSQAKQAGCLNEQGLISKRVNMNCNSPNHTPSSLLLHAVSWHASAWF